MTSSRIARLAALALTGALASGLAAPAAAAHQLRPTYSDPTPAPTPAPVAGPNAPSASDNDPNGYCKEDPDWYLCQHHHGK